MTQFEMIFYACFTAIGVYASAFYVWGIVWDAIEKRLRRKAPFNTRRLLRAKEKAKAFHDAYEKKYPSSDPRNADAWEAYYNRYADEFLAPSPSFEEAYKAKCAEMEQRRNGAS